MVTLERQ